MTNNTQDDLLDLVHASIFARGLDGTILSWNRASTELYGWTREQAVGRTIHDLLGGRHGSLQAAQQTLLTAGSWEGELTRRAACGGERRIEARWSVRRDTQGTPVEIIEIGHPIRRAEVPEVTASTDDWRYPSLFQAMSAAFLELDFRPVAGVLRDLRASGITDLRSHFEHHPGVVRQIMRQTRIVDVNDATLQILGVPDRSKLYSSIEPYWPESSTADYASALLAALDRQPHVQAETRLNRQDGTGFEALMTAAFPWQGASRGTFLVGVVDMSGRVRAQAELNRRLTDICHATHRSMLGEVAASIAHEVNQPLAAIITNAAAGLRWLGRDEPNIEQTLKVINCIGADAQRAGDIIARVRGRAAQAQRPPERLPLNTVIHEAVQVLEFELQNRGIHLVLELAPNLADVSADRTQLQQVLVNLATNAAEAMTEITGPREIHICSTATGSDQIEVTVRDTGPGVADDQIDQLFRSFSSTRASSMGMGLAICRSILQAHGGTIRAANAGGGGAVFTLRLPAAA